MILKLKLLVRRLLAHIPQPFPRNSAQLDAFIADVLELADMNPSETNTQAACTALMHVDISKVRVQKSFVIGHLRRMEAQNVAFTKLEEMKAARMAAKNDSKTAQSLTAKVE
jgi:hypothetical protein